MKNNSLLSIIIVNYNTKDLLQQCLHSLFEAVNSKSQISPRHPDFSAKSKSSGSSVTGEPTTIVAHSAEDAEPPIVIVDQHDVLSNSLEIIIVDNNSADGSREFLKELNSKSSPRHPDFSTKSKSSGSSVTGEPITVIARLAEDAEPSATMSEDQYDNNVAIPDNIEIKTILNKTNLGFAKANNQGIKIARGKYILLLNSDTIVKPGALEEMTAFAEKHPEAGIVGPKLLNSDDSLQPSCFHFPTIWGAIKEFWLGKKNAFSKYAPRAKTPVAVNAVVGAAFLISPQARARVGLLNERYFFYFEDLDYCRQIWKNGLKVYYLPEAEIVHLHGVSGKKLNDKPNKWLVESSKIYYGRWQYYLITAIIKLSQWRKRLIK